MSSIAFLLGAGASVDAGLATSNSLGVTTAFRLASDGACTGF